MKQQLYLAWVLVAKEDAEITRSRLPTDKQVIRCCMFHRQKETFEGATFIRTKKDNAKIVQEKVIPFYLKENISVISAKIGCKKIIELFKKNAKLQEIHTGCRRRPL